MKKMVLCAVLVASTLQLFAQIKKTTKKPPVNHPVYKPAVVVVKQKEAPFSVLNKNFLDPGVGLGTYYKGLPFGVSYEHGFTDLISAGAFVNYSGYNYPDIGAKINFVYFGVRGSYHFAQLFNVTNPKFDPYGGVSLGYYSVNVNGENFTPYSSTVFFGVHAGARYMFSDKVGGFAEVGYGVAALQVGASFKF